MKDNNDSCPKALSEVSREFVFPDSPPMLAEINLPADVIAAVLGKMVTVNVLPAETAMTRRIDPDQTEGESPCLIDRDGLLWNDHRPVCVQFTDDQGRVWRCPRYWLDEVPSKASLPDVDESVVTEEINLPTEWDMGDINISPLAAHRSAGKPVPIEVRIKSGEVETTWCDSEDVQWRIPSDWRRRVVRLPDAPILAAEGVPESMADRCAMQVVSVNYHPGSLCCMPEHYRFRDVYGDKWPVRISDCALMGYGNSCEGSA